eukprot:GHVN01036348.1.p1 GENE.GHVN01036348.1~~GHVN01036348.1.p1  ORF type:complete len:303 (+),score=25.31 GHVN01036348.1:105-911(+)
MQKARWRIRRHIPPVWSPPTAAAPLDSQPRGESGALWQIPKERSSAMSLIDVGKFRVFHREFLLHALPEGLPDGMAAFSVLHPPNHPYFGVMLRSETVLVANALRQLQGCKDPAGNPHIPINGFALDGEAGVGKSAIMMSLAIWGRENGWLTIFEPTMDYYVRARTPVQRSVSGIYPQNEKSQWFLKRIAVLNKSMLQDIPVNMDVLGAFSSSGVSYDLLTSHCEEMFAKAAEQEIQAEHITEASTAEQRKKELIQQHKRNMKSGSLR